MCSLETGAELLAEFGGIEYTNLIGSSGQICDTAEFAIVRRSTLALGLVLVLCFLYRIPLSFLCSFTLLGKGLSLFRNLSALYILPFRAVSPRRCLSLQNSLRRPPSFLRFTRFTLPRYLVANGLEYTSCLDYISYQDVQILHYQSNSVTFVPRLRCFVAAMPPLSGPEAWQ